MDCFDPLFDCFAAFLIVFRDFWEFLILLVFCLFDCVFGLPPLVGQAGLGTGLE